jgi:AraC family transcriptional regulator, positive regulator of tynA and feaB
MGVWRREDDEMTNGRALGTKPANRVSQWRESVCRQLIGVEVETGPSEDFAGRFANCTIGRSNLAEVTATPMAVFRTNDLIARDTEPFHLINLVVQGRARAVQGRNDHVVGIGDLFIQSADQPYSLDLDLPFRIVTLRVPTALLSQYVFLSDAIYSVPLALGGKTASIAASVLRSLKENVREISREDAELAVGAVLRMTAAAAASLAPPSRAPSHASFGRISKLIDQNLQRPDLTPALVAKLAGVSSRQLNRAFENEGEKVSRVILRRRLERCRLDLLSRACAGRTVGDIAFFWGFNNLSHFSESFRRTYGIAPSALRRVRFQES